MDESRTPPFDRWIAAALLGAVFATASVARAAQPGAPSTGQDSPTSATSIDPVFDCYRANSAWGLAYSGKVIDRDGWIFSYGARGKALPEPIKSDDHKLYDAAELQAKYAGGTRGSRIEASALAEHVALIEKASSGKIVSTNTGVRDAGTSTCHAYVFDATTKRYRDVELGSDEGVADRRVSNDAAEAQTLLQWLRTSGVAQ
jgi:hypothetical protein